jgi:hypothetical protein
VLVALGRVVLRPVALTERPRVLAVRPGQQPAVVRLVVARVRPAVELRVVAQVRLAAAWATAWAVELRVALRLRRAPADKTTAGLRCRARASRAASRPGRRACHLKSHAPID